MRSAHLMTFAVCFAFTGCFEVENGPAFSGGDEVPGFEGTFFVIGEIDPTDGPHVQPADEDDSGPSNIRRAVNGSYIVTNNSDQDYFIIRPRLIEGHDYVIEYSSSHDENWLGILRLDHSDSLPSFTICADLEWENDAIFAVAAEHNVGARTQMFSGKILTSDDPDALFAFMADLWQQTQLGDWHCSILSQTPPTPSQTKTQDKE